MRISQIVISSRIKHAPNVFVFTEQGVAMLSGVLNRNMSKESILRGLKILRDKNVMFSVCNIIGAPGETLDTAIETWALSVKAKPTFCDSFILIPYPKTNIYEYSMANGFLNPDIKYPETYHEKIILDLKDKKQLENFMHLLGVAVEFPSLMPLIRNVLIKLPLRFLYNRIRKFWKGYVYRYRIYPYKVSPVRAYESSIMKYLFQRCE